MAVAKFLDPIEFGLAFFQIEGGPLCHATPSEKLLTRAQTQIPLHPPRFGPRICVKAFLKISNAVVTHTMTLYC